MTSLKEVSDLSNVREKFTELTDGIRGRVIGQDEAVDFLSIALLANGHVLLEGAPGLAKTRLARLFSASIEGDFKRIQFTPDLLPSDLIGSMLYLAEKGSFDTKKGPVFAHLVLADEINRAPAKVQSALLEAMAERQVTLGGQSFGLPEPFLVLATQNPLEQEGTYALPEAQMDRFMFKVNVGYPSDTEERQILDSMAKNHPRLDVSPVVTVQEILQAQDAVDEVHVDDRIKDYIVDLVLTTRDPTRHGLELSQYLEAGASPRATIALTQSCKAWALLTGRAFVTPSDVKKLAPDVLRHRLVMSWEAEAAKVRAEDLVTQILDAVPVP